MNKQIAFISEHASPLATLGGVDSGGQNVYVAETARQLAKMGFDVDIFTRWDDKCVQEIVTWAPGIRVIHVRAGKKEMMPKEQLLQHMHEFRDEMLDFILRGKKQYMLIHAHFFMSALVAADIKTILNIPFVVTFHALGVIRKRFQGINDGFPRERIDIEKRIVREADAIIAECPQDLCDLVKYYGAQPQKIEIVPCGFSSKEFYPVDKTYARQRLGIHPEEKILLQLGRMVRRKGVDNVIRSLGRLRKDNCACKLMIVGGEGDPEQFDHDPEVLRLKRLASEEGVCDDVVFAGRKSRKELKYYYSAADIFITTPWYEPFGITPLEAMACGTPVIGANVGGIKFSVVDGVTGLLVPPQNPEALADKVKLLLYNNQLVKKLSENAMMRVKDTFTWQRVCTQLCQLYAGIEASAAVMPHSFYRIKNAV